MNKALLVLVAVAAPCLSDSESKLRFQDSDTLPKISGKYVKEDITSEKTYYFSIPSQPLQDALIQFARYIQHNILSPQHIVEKYRSRPVVGTFTAKQALELILGDAPLSYHLDADIKLWRIESGEAKNSENIMSDGVLRQLEEVIVTGRYVSIATGFEQALSRAPAVASVVSSEYIQKLGAQDIDDVIQSVPGLHVSRSSNSYNPIYVFRGIHTDFNSQVLVLINGIPLTNLHAGNRSQVWGGMPVDAIERIEILRGPGSALYGAEAFAGVINIITKSRDSLEGNSLKVAAGSYSSRSITVSHGGDYLGWGAGVIAEYYKSDGHGEIVDADAQSKFDDIFETNASYAPVPVGVSSENFDVRLDLRKNAWRLRMGSQIRRDVGLGTGISEAIVPSNRESSDRHNADITWNKTFFSGDLDVTSQVSLLESRFETGDSQRLFPEGANFDLGVFEDGVIGNPNLKERHKRFNLSAFVNRFEKHSIHIGVGYYHGDMREVKESKNFEVVPVVRSDGSIAQLLQPLGEVIDVSDTDAAFLPEVKRNNRFIYFQDVWQLTDNLELTNGIRLDNYSQFGSTANKRIAVVWTISESLTSKLLYGEAFKAPSFVEAYATNNPVIIGNPNLDPERIKTAEWVISYQRDDTFFSQVNFYRYRWSDIIGGEEVEGTSAKRAVNAGTQIGKGFEFEANWSATERLSFLTHFSHLDSEQDLTGARAPFVPHKQFHLSSSYTLTDKFSLSLHVNRVMDRVREIDDTRKSVDDYTRTDLSISYLPFKNRLKFKFVVRNIFNDDVRQPSAFATGGANIPNDLPEAGRNYFLSSTFSF